MIILKINIDEGEALIAEIANQVVSDFILSCRELPEEYRYATPSPLTPRLPVEHLMISAEALSGPYRIIQYESGTIAVESDGIRQPVAKPILRKIASELGISLLNASENKKNTRQLGADVIAALNA